MFYAIYMATRPRACACIFQNTRSHAISITYYPPPLSVQPEVTLSPGTVPPVEEGDSLTLTCTDATGMPPPTFQWRRGDQIISGTPILTITTHKIVSCNSWTALLVTVISVYCLHSSSVVCGVALPPEFSKVYSYFQMCLFYVCTVK